MVVVVRRVVVVGGRTVWTTQLGPIPPLVQQNGGSPPRGQGLYDGAGVVLRVVVVGRRVVVVVLRVVVVGLRVVVVVLRVVVVG